jgi:hypothetical protein
VIPADIHDFFLAGAGVAGALIGLLFVAISVSAERLAKAEASAQMQRVRAYAALTAFINALAVSLFALIPGEQLGTAALVVAILGLLFVTASLLSLIRVRAMRSMAVRDAVLLAGLTAAFVYQLVAGADLNANPGDVGSVHTIAILMIVFFLVGIARAWELIGGPTIGFEHEVTALVRGDTPAEEGAKSPESAGTPEA